MADRAKLSLLPNPSWDGVLPFVVLENKMKRLQIVALVKLFCLRFRKEPTGAHPQLAPNELP